MGPVALSGRHRAPPLAPYVRGHVPPRILAALAAAGWRIHRIGQAAYAHSPDGALHLIFGVWAHRFLAPGWADRLGRASAGYLRRVDRCTREQRWRRLARDARGRWMVLLPWYRWPAPAVYRFEPSTAGWWDLERERVDRLNRELRAGRGLVAETAGPA